MKVNEIFKSIQGESTWQGFPCIFVRLSGCNLRCTWCDTKYAYENGNEMSVEEIINTVRTMGCVAQSRDGVTPPLQLMEITGGEPLLQPEVYELSNKLLTKGYKVLVDTNGSLSAGNLPKEVIRIIDIKCPGSGMSDRMCWDNLKNLRPTDEIKFAISDYRDYEWAKDVIKKYKLLDQVKVLFSPVFMDARQVLLLQGPTGRLKFLHQPIGQPSRRGRISTSFQKGLPLQIAEWILRDNVPVRLQLQLHKYLGVR